jgi:hypothetical protein
VDQSTGRIPCAQCVPNQNRALKSVVLVVVIAVEKREKW